jgi:TonB family protein
MTHFRIFSLFSIFVTFVVAVNGQAAPAKVADEWIRVESKTKEFSISLPSSDFLVDDDSKRVTLWYFGPGYSIEFIVEMDKIFKKILKEAEGSPIISQNTRFFETGDFVGFIKEQTDARTNIRAYSMDFASSKGDYKLMAYFDNNSIPVADRLLRSIKVENQRFLNSPVTDPSEQRLISASDLKPSDVISKALSQAPPKDLKFTDDLLPSGAPVIDRRTYSRQLLLLRKPSATPTPSAIERKIRGTVQLYVTFLADGTIGSIGVAKSLDRELDRQAFNAAKQIKFLPAEIDEKPVDASRYISYDFNNY